MVRTIDKAVVLAAGRGTRMRAPAGAMLTSDQAAAADAGAKPLIPVGAARPFLDYSLSALADAGFGQICLVIAPSDTAIRDRYSRGLPLQRLRIAFAEQPGARGTADALLAARDFAGDDEFLVLNADNYYPIFGLDLLRNAGEPATLAFARDGLLRSGQIEADRLSRYALLDVGADGYLRDVVEKPDVELARARSSVPISMNVWRFDRAIFEACRTVPLSARGELELPTAVQHGLRAGELRIRALPIDAEVLDLSHRADIPAVDAALRAMPVCL
jgi:glucose-1-phosphate thymidylyltransferase